MLFNQAWFEARGSLFPWPFDWMLAFFFIKSFKWAHSVRWNTLYDLIIWVLPECFRKEGAFYPHGYDLRQLYDTFLVRSLCNCYACYNKQCCIWNPPQTIALYYRCPGKLTLTQMWTLKTSLLRRRFTVHTHCRVTLCDLEVLPTDASIK